jgi:hypothetical protein
MRLGWRGNFLSLPKPAHHKTRKHRGGSKSLDWRVRKAKRKGIVSAEELADVRAKILALIG